MDRLGGGGLDRSKVIMLVCVAGVVVGVWIYAIIAVGGDDSEANSGTPPQTTARQTTPDAAQTTPAANGAYVPPKQADIPHDDHAHGAPKSEYPDDAKKETAKKPEPEKPAASPAQSEAKNTKNGGGSAGAKPNEDPKVEEGRKQNAALQFVIKAYGYTGSDASEYTSNVNQTVVSPEFYESPGAESVNAVIREVDAKGTESTASLDSFEMEEEGGTTGTAYFSIKDKNGGGKFSQELELKKWGAVYKVISAGKMEEA